MDNTPSTIGVEDIKFINGQHAWEYITYIPAKTKHISQPSLGSAQSHFEITAPFCMYVLGYTFSL